MERERKRNALMRPAGIHGCKIRAISAALPNKTIAVSNRAKMPSTIWST